MANTRSAKKNVRKSEARRLVNSARASAIKTAIKKLNASLQAGAGDAELTAMLRDIEAKLARAKSKKVMHANTADRKLSRLVKRVNGHEATA